ncbi:MAG: DUF4230 domain-containing protein [Longimicrobiales bacterium]
MTTTPADPSRTTLRVGRWIGGFLLATALVALGIGIALWQARPRLSEEEIQRLAFTSIQRESAESFLVTGSLALRATATVASRRILLPEFLDLEIGRTSATVRVPAKVSYGFDVRGLDDDMIDVEGDSIIEVEIPPLRIYSIETDLSALEIETRQGWLRLDGDTPDRLERQALANIERAFREQAQAHLRDSTQPRINTARALQRLLVPVLGAAGITDPDLRFEITSEIELRPTS